MFSRDVVVHVWNVLVVLNEGEVSQAQHLHRHRRVLQCSRHGHCTELWPRGDEQHRSTAAFVVANASASQDRCSKAVVCSTQLAGTLGVR